MRCALEVLHQTREIGPPSPWNSVEPKLRTTALTGRRGGKEAQGGRLNVEYNQSYVRTHSDAIKKKTLFIYRDES